MSVSLRQAAAGTLLILPLRAWIEVQVNLFPYYFLPKEGTDNTGVEEYYFLQYNAV
jgi:hypothetical protein